MVSRDPESEKRDPVIRVNPPVGQVRWGDLDRLLPFCSLWGSGRGRPVDRFYIEQFLGANQSDFCGAALEVENANYLHKYGRGQIESFDVLDVNPDNGNATMIANLATGVGVPEAAFDCFVMTQTLQFIYEVNEAIYHAHRLLKRGGVMLATVPGIAPQPSRDAYTRDCCWSFTMPSIERVFGDVFGSDNIQVRSFGNVRTATAFLWGLAMEEVTPEQYAFDDPDYPVIISVRACKA